MRKTLLVLLAIALVGFAGQASARTNTGSDSPGVFTGNVITPDTGGPRILFAPTQPDNPTYRAAMATQVGGTCDYFDCRTQVPSVAFLAGYDCVMTWVNYAYLDNNATGDNLATFVDNGGHVILGQWTAHSTQVNWLQGRIMTSAYCPITASGVNFTASMWDGSDPTCCVHTGVGRYGSNYRDIIHLNTGATACGHFQDQTIANAMYAAQTVVYAAGACSDYSIGEDANRAANGCVCGAASANQPSTWGAVKDLYR